MALRSGRRTEPTITISVTPALRSARTMPPICAQPTLVSGKSLEVAIALAEDGHDVHRSAARLDVLGDLARQATAACHNADDARLARHTSVLIAKFVV